MSPLQLLVVTAALVCVSHAAMTAQQRTDIVNEHNRIRRSVGSSNMIKMEYDMKLECVAQAYIQTQSNSFQHNQGRTEDYASCGGSGYVGENWFSAGPGLDDFFGGATYAWCDYKWNGCSERENYYGTNGCSGTDGHFTQVAWAKSRYVGCGYTQSGGTVCNYSPGGNFNGEPPFVVGAACSACPAGSSCDNGLCSFGAVATSQAPVTSSPTTSQEPDTSSTSTKATGTIPQVTGTPVDVEVIISISLDIDPSTFDAAQFAQEIALLLDIPINAIKLVEVNLDLSTAGKTYLTFRLVNVLDDNGVPINPVAKALELQKIAESNDPALSQQYNLNGLQVISTEVESSASSVLLASIPLIISMIALL